MISDRIIALSWATFFGFWALGAITARASIGRRRWLRWFLSAYLIVPAMALAYVALATGKLPQHDSPTAAARVMGAGICVLGIAIAVWARTCLGPNWGMPMTQRESPELVTSGPYAYVRHPIYTGMLLAIMGTMVATNPSTMTGWLVAFAYFAISAVKEERDLLEFFPEQYRAYMARTRRLIPFLW